MVTSCLCGSSKNYSDCCGLYIEQHELPPTPEKLMRSRYTAYCLTNTTYIKATMLGTPLFAFNETELLLQAKKWTWLGLTIIDSKLSPKNESTGFVEFIAHLQVAGKKEIIHERSQFEKYNDRWYYTGSVPPLFSKQLKKFQPFKPSK